MATTEQANSTACIPSNFAAPSWLSSTSAGRHEKRDLHAGAASDSPDRSMRPAHRRPDGPRWLRRMPAMDDHDDAQRKGSQAGMRGARPSPQAPRPSPRSPASLPRASKRHRRAPAAACLYCAERREGRGGDAQRESRENVGHQQERENSRLRSARAAGGTACRTSKVIRAGKIRPTAASVIMVAR